VFHHRLFAAMASRPTVPVLMASAPMAPGETAEMASAFEALASASVVLAEADLERLPTAKYQLAPAGQSRPAWPRADGSDKLQATS
jgi:hypothetical protein